MKCRYYQGEFDGSSKGSATAKSDTKYYVGVHDPAAGTLVLHDAGLFKMASTVKSSELVGLDQRDLTTSTGQIAARAQLTDAFGGKRKRQAASAKQRYSMDDSALDVIKDVARSTLVRTASQAVGMDDEDKESGRPIPPFDQETEDNTQIYPFNTLIAPAAMVLLKAPATLLCKAGQDQLDKWRKVATGKGCVHPTFVLDSLQSCMHNKLKAKVRRVQILVYISLLVKFRTILKRPATMATLKKLLCNDLNAPEEVVVGLVQKFATEMEDDEGKNPENNPDKTKYRMSGFQKDMAVSYTFVLAMASDDYRQIATSALAADMELTDKRARDYLRSLGCKVKSATAEAPQCAELVAPLKFPLRLGRAT